MSSTSTTTVIDAYFDMWNDQDADAVAGHISRAWDDSLSYVDPLFTAANAAELEAMVAAFHTQYPGHRFLATGEPLSHHDRTTWGWQLVDPHGAPIANGVDFAVLAENGRLREVTGFFTPVAP